MSDPAAVGQREPIDDAIAAYMGLMDAVGTEMRTLAGLSEDSNLVERLSGEVDDAVERYRARATARQAAAP